jgi:hypothetical protein
MKGEGSENPLEGPPPPVRKRKGYAKWVKSRFLKKKDTGTWFGITIFTIAQIPKFPTSILLPN